MRIFTQVELKAILDKHELWLDDEVYGERADLRSADLRSADLSSANLRSANLSSADLSFADLRFADLSSANLRSANLSSADLRSADLSSANLRSANLSSADLSFADLSSANLRSANLSSADLRCASLQESILCNTIGEMLHIKSGQLETYLFAYTDKYLQIGCERHDIEEWWSFDNDRIKEMEGDKALEFWTKWKPVLKQIIEMSPAEPTEYKENE